MITYDFSGQVVVVTGAARGVGRQIVLDFTRLGASVIAADRDVAGLDETAKLAGTRVSTIAADISDPVGRRASSGRPSSDTDVWIPASTTPRSHHTPACSTRGWRSGTRCMQSTVAAPS